MEIDEGCEPGTCFHWAQDGDRMCRAQDKLFKASAYGKMLAEQSTGFHEVPLASSCM